MCPRFGTETPGVSFSRNWHDVLVTLLRAQWQVMDTPMISVLSYQQYDPSYYALHNEPKGGGQKELCENSKIKDLELIFTRIHIRKHEKDMSSQIK